MQFTVIMLKRKILGKNVQLKKKKKEKTEVSQSEIIVASLI